MAVLPSDSLQLSSSYRDLVQTKFGGYIPSMPYTEPHKATGVINTWAQEQTGEKVQQMVTFLSLQTQLLLTTVAYYQSTYHLSGAGVGCQRAEL